MKSYTELTAKIKADNRSTEDHMKAAKEAREQARAFRSMKAEAVASGDQEAHADICRKITFYEERAAMEEAKAKKVEIPLNAYVEAWEEYAEDYNKTFSKKLAAFTKARKEMAAAYMELLKIRAEGNGQKLAMWQHLKGERLGRFEITETLSPLADMPQTMTTRQQTAEEALTAAAYHLDEGRCENMRGIINGIETDADIYAESFNEIADKIKAAEQARPVFPYPVYLPETEEEKLKRTIKGDLNAPVGYVMNNGKMEIDQDFYKHKEEALRVKLKEEAKQKARRVNHG